MWTMLGGLAAQGLFGGTEMASNIPILQLLALFIAIAGCGAVCAVQFPARRFASVLIGLFLVPLAAGSIAAGSRPLLYLPVMLIIYAGICAGNITSRRQTALADIQARFNADRLARLDYLTGLLNRLALTEAITELERTGTTQFSVFCLDIDGLKAINHEYGRGAGDGVLQAVAARLSVNVWPGDTIVRIAEDEFVLLAPGMQQAEAERLCKRLRQRISNEPYNLGHSNPLTIDVSIGHATAPEDGPDFDTLYKLALNELRLAKSEHRASVRDTSAG
jgi:diguanylate cyclase (GGDEF)-like protein